MEVAPKVAPYVKPAWRVLDGVVKAGKRVLFEGAQAAMLDVDHGTYPYVTSSNTMAGQAAAGAGVGPSASGYVLGIVKAYTTRVGEGPFPTELHDAIGRKLGERGDEFGTVTGRPRRCGWFDAVLVRQSVTVSGIEGVVLTKLDVLDGIETLRSAPAIGWATRCWTICRPACANRPRFTPIYEEIAGWTQSTKGARSWRDLPANAVIYVRRIEELIGAPAVQVTTGPDRDDTIVMRDPFQG